MTSAWGDCSGAIRAAILDGCMSAEAHGFVWCRFAEIDDGLKAEAAAMADAGLVVLDPEFDAELEDCLSVARAVTVKGGAA